MNGLSKVVNVLAGLWLAAALLLLTNGLTAASTGGGELAMSMFVITLPVSIGTGMLLNAVAYLHQPAWGVVSPYVFVWLVWLPNFVAGSVQWVVLMWVAKWLAQRASKRS